MIGGDGALLRGIARGIVVYRWLTLAWAWAGLLLQRGDVEHLALALGSLAAMSAVTAAATVVAARDAPGTLRPLWIAVELAVATGVLLLDGFAFGPGRAQSLPWAWPAAGIISAAVAGGMAWAVAAGLWIAVASFGGESLLRGRVEWTVSTASKSALYLLAGVAAAHVARRLRDAEVEIALSRARDEVARTLHDGVLQTLAVIQRRSGDDALRAVARDQDRELRAFLFGRDQPPSGVAAALRDAVRRTEQRFGVTVELVVAEDVPELGAAQVAAVGGAVGEALANAAKHSGGDRIVVFAEPADGEDDDELFCSVRDNGVGFDATAGGDGVAGMRAGGGQGIDRSIRDRMAEVGGRVEIDGRPGRGTEVRLWVR